MKGSFVRNLSTFVSVLVASAIAGCAPAAMQMPATQAPLATSAQGQATVTVNIGSLPQIRTAARKTQAYGEALDDLPITKLRLVRTFLVTEGESTSFQTEVLATVDWTPGTAEAPKAPTPITGTIPAGVNQMITVQALGEGDDGDDDGEVVLLQLRGMVNAVAGKNATVKLNFIDDFVAGVFYHLMEDVVTPNNKVKCLELLANETLAADLRTFAKNYLHYDEAANTYVGVPPYRMDAAMIAEVAKSHSQASMLVIPDDPDVDPEANYYWYSMYHYGELNGGIQVDVEDVLPPGAIPSEYDVQAIAPPAPDVDEGYWRLANLVYHDVDPPYYQTTDLSPGTYTIVVTHHPIDGPVTRTFHERTAYVEHHIPLHL